MNNENNNLSAVQRVRAACRQNWKVGQLIAFSHGPDRKNIYRFRVVSLGDDGTPMHSKLVGGRPWKNTEK